MSDSNLNTSKRLKLAILAFSTILLGLASRRYPVFGNYPGDALWATLVGLGWALIFPSANLLKIATLSLGTCLVVEFSQLYHAPWLDQLRSTLPGRLVLGSGFDPFDLVAYTIGTFVALLALKRLRTCSTASPKQYHQN